MKWFIVLVIAAGVSVGVSYPVAKMDLGERARDFEGRLRELGPERSGQLPTEEEVTRRVLRFARERGLEASDVAVEIRQSEESLGGAVGGTVRKFERATDALRQAAEGMQGRVPKGGPPSDALSRGAAKLGAGTGLSVASNEIRIQGRLRGKKWFWKHDQAFDITVRIIGDLSR